MKSGRKSGTVLEYAALIAAVVAALIGMSYLIKGAICGKWREQADTFGYGRQYEPGKTTVTEK